MAVIAARVSKMLSSLKIRTSRALISDMIKMPQMFRPNR